MPRDHTYITIRAQWGRETSNHNVLSTDKSADLEEKVKILDFKLSLYKIYDSENGYIKAISTVHIPLQ